MQIRILDHQKSMSVLQLEHERAKEESKHLQEQLTSLSDQLSRKEVEVSTLRQESGAQEEKVQQNTSNGQQSLPHLEEVLRQTQERLERGERELFELRQELERSAGREDALKTKCSQLEHNLSETHRQGAGDGKLQAVLTQVNEELKHCKQALEKKDLELQEASTAQSNLAGALSARDEEIKTLGRAVQDFKQANASQKSVMDKLGGEREEREERVRSLEVANGSLNTELTRLRARLQEMEREKEQGREGDGKLQALQQENAKCSRQLANLRNHLMEVCTVCVRGSCVRGLILHSVCKRVNLAQCM